jgi:hypothetical protein
MSLEEKARTPESFPKSPPRICTHSRLISDSVTEEEHNAGKVRFVECGDVVSDPHF